MSYVRVIHLMICNNVTQITIGQASHSGITEEISVLDSDTPCCDNDPGLGPIASSLGIVTNEDTCLGWWDANMQVLAVTFTFM